MTVCFCALLYMGIMSKMSRKFNWRYKTDPYHIVVSEIMLQQTQTSRVMGKIRSIREWCCPSFEALAQAPGSRCYHSGQDLDTIGVRRHCMLLQNKLYKILQESFQQIQKFYVNLPEWTQYCRFNLCICI